MDSAVKQVVHPQGNSLVDGVPGNIKPHQSVDGRIGFGVGADRDAHAAIRANGFPIGKTFFLVNGPVAKIPTAGFSAPADGFGWAIVGAFLTDATKFGHVIFL